MEKDQLIPVFIFFSFSVYIASFNAYAFGLFEPLQDQTYSIVPTNDVDPTLQRICDNTDYPIECLTTTIPFLGENVNVPIDPMSILIVEIEATGGKAKEALDMASKLLLDPSTSKPATFCLETCIDNYNVILERKQRVLDAISMSDTSWLRLELSVYAKNVYACEDAFKEAGIKSPIAD